MTSDAVPLGVVVKGWPRLSETFIAQELKALEDAGQSFDIWSLRHPTDKKRHPVHDAIKARVHYLPEYLHDEPLRVLRGLGAARRLPGFVEAFAIWRRDFARDISRNRIRRFGQACVLATELAPGTRALYAHFLHTPSSVTRYAAVMLGLPWAFSAHAKDIWTSPEWEKREKLNPAAHGAAFGATCTGYGADHLRDLCDQPDRINLIYHGLDLSRFPPPPDRPRDPSAAEIRLLSVGRLVEKKGFDRLIDALALLPPDLRWTWTHMGGGELRAALSARADRLGVADRITWRGASDQPEVIAAMRAADIFVLPSRIASDGDRDGLPNVLMEAASQKLPIISTRVAAIPEFIEDGISGVLSADEPQALAAAILALATDPPRCLALSEAAHRRLVSGFTTAPGIARLNRLLNSLQGKP